MSDLRAELGRIDEALAAFPPDAATDSPGVAVMRSSLERHRREVAASASTEKLALHLERPAHAGTGGELKLVALVLGALQDSLGAIAQTVKGEATARGLLPAEVLRGVELRVASATEGSLNLTLTPAFPEAEPLFQDAASSALDVSVMALGRVLNGAMSDAEAVLHEIAELGPRATSHIGTLAKSIADAEATLDMGWQSPEHRVFFRLDRTGAARLRTVMESVTTHQREATFTGRLAGGSLLRSTFEFEVDDDSVFRGSVDPEAMADLEQLFGQPCVAAITTTSLVLPTGETKETHRLTSLRP